MKKLLQLLDNWNSLSLRKKAQVKRVLLAWTILIIVAILILVLLIVGIRAIVKKVSNKENNIKESVMDDSQINLVSDGEDYLSPTPHSDGEDDEAKEALDDKLQTDIGDSVIHGLTVWGGYEVKKTDSTRYISNENVQSTYGILIDARTGNVVCQKEGFTRINPASMTKILTVLVAAEHVNIEDLDKEITITPEDTYYAYKHDLSVVGFSDGEKVKLRDLFYGTILPSGADAAIALARYVASDDEAFIQMLNDKIAELGLSQTSHFTNCVGLYGEDHYSTCADMAIMLKAALENELCYEVLNAHKYVTSSTQEHPDGIEISNWFLRRIEDKDTGGEVLCAKTGYVNQAGSCAASFSRQNDGAVYFCVTAQAHSAWRCIYDHVEIYSKDTK